MRVLLKIPMIMSLGLCTSFNFPNPFDANVMKPKANFQSSRIMKEASILEDELLELIQDRLTDDAKVDVLVEKLEKIESIPEPSIAPEVYGRWKLIATTNVNTSSPIQRTAVDNQKYNIYQDIIVKDDNSLIVSQVVDFGEGKKLSVDALGSTAAYPLEELQQRKGDGKIVGLNLLGVSLIGEEAEEDKSRPNSRIYFVFDEGKFDFNGLQIPYPVPFRLPILRDAVKGWIDITYLSNRVRISR